MEDDLLQKAIGEAARTAREGLGLTQAQVAQKAGMSAQVYGRIERGGMMPSVPALRRLAVALGVSPAVLLGMSPREVPTTDKDLSPEIRKAVRDPADVAGVQGHGRMWTAARARRCADA